LNQVHEALDVLEEMIFTSYRIFGRTLVDENQLGDQITAIHNALPKVIQEAKRVIQQRDEILEEAQHYAKAIIDEANRRAEYLIRESTIVRQAQLQAAQIRQQTQQERERILQQTYLEAEHLKQEADRYADQVLADLEQRLVASLQVIQNGRQHLR
ncbi:MAG: hypothetical protein Q6J78_03750, partial [Thermostichales cyanobacterium SRBZ-1_bins_19]